MDFNYIFKYHLIKPLYMFQYNQLKKKKIIINDDLYLGKGNRKLVYLYPNDKTKCIKIENRKNKKLWNNLHEEFRFFKIYGDKPKYITNFYGIVKTNKGIGLVYETVLDYNGNISKDLPNYIKTNLKFQDKQKIDNFMKKFNDFNYKFIKKYKSSYGHLYNIFVKVIDKENYEFIVIDDFMYYNHLFEKDKEIKKKTKHYLVLLKTYLK